jgi:hypothetical protein
MLSSVSIPVLLIMAAVVGVLLGFLISILFKSEPKSTAEESPLPQKYIEKGYAEGVRVYYSPAEKQAVPFMDGDVYPDFTALTPEQKKRALRWIQALNEWGGVQPAAEMVNKSPEVTPEPSETGLLTEAIPVEPRKAAPPPPLPESKKPVLDLVDEPSKPEPPKPAKVQTIVEQIDEIMQELSVGRVEASRGIKLVDDGHNGVIVYVGAEKYRGVDEVPYPEVQELIRNAVTKWEETATLKK